MKLTTAQARILSEIKEGKIAWSAYNSGSGARAYYVGAVYNAKRPSIIVIRDLHRMQLIELPGRMSLNRTIVAK